MNYKGTTRKTLKVAASASLISVGLMGVGAGTALAQESPSTPGVTQPGKAKTPAPTAAPKTEQPSTPGTDQPSTPGGGTDQPSTPGTEQPSTPGGDGGTDQPSTPGGGTDQPGTPTEPTKPTQPTEPSTPTQPTQPSTPTEPTQPTQPTQPTEPSTPTQPTQPSTPTQPTQPVKPVTPIKQAPVDNIRYTLDVNGSKFGAPVTDATPQGNLNGYSAQFQVRDSGNYLNIGLPGQKPQTITWSHEQAQQWEDSAYQLAGPFAGQVKQFVKDFQKNHGGAVADWAQGVTNGGVRVTTPAPAPAVKPAPKVETAPAPQQVNAPAPAPTPAAVKPAQQVNNTPAPAPAKAPEANGPVQVLKPLAKQVGVKVDFNKLPGTNNAAGQK